MKRYAVLLLALSLGGCGYSQLGGEVIGQAKRLGQFTPLICSNYDALDISMGVMQNGVGSMSTEDEWFYIDPQVDRKALQAAVDGGYIIKVQYNVWRVTWCVPNHELVSFTVVRKP